MVRVAAERLRRDAVELQFDLERRLAGREAGALAALVSGSGPTTAFLVRDADAADTVARALRASGTCRAVRTAAGPAAGATVL